MIGHYRVIFLAFSFSFLILLKKTNGIRSSNIIQILLLTSFIEFLRKNYLSSTALSKEDVIEKYNQLWQIEKTFRISKTDLQIRPIYHYLKRRIEAHICISFAACKIYKELERQLKLKKSNYSPEQVIDILKTIYQISFKTPNSKNMHNKLILKTEGQKSVINLFNLEI